MGQRRTRLWPEPTPEASQAVLLVATAGRMALSLLLTITVGRYLPPEDLGFFALVSTIFGLGHEVTDMGSGNVAVRMIAREPASERRILDYLLGLRLVLSLAAAAAAAMLALFQPSRYREAMVFGTAAILGFAYVGGVNTAYMVRQRQIPPSLVSVGVQFAALVAALALVRSAAPAGWFPAIVLLREAAVLVALQILGTRLLGYVPQPRFSRAALGPFFGRAAIVAASTLFYHLQLQGGMFFIEFLRPDREMAPFGAALRPLAPVLFIPWVLMLPLIPLLSWLAARRRADFARQARGTMELAIGFGAVVAVTTWQLAPALLELLYGDKFTTGPLSAIGTLRWLALPLGCSFLTAAISTILLADHREAAVLRLTGFGLLIYVAGNLVLLPLWGFVGSAASSAVSILVLTLGGLRLLGTAPERIVPGPATLLYLLPAAAMSAGLAVAPNAMLPRLALGALLSAAAMLAVWQVPAAQRYRRDQADLSRSALAADAGPNG